jgi:hypothetical protein
MFTILSLLIVLIISVRSIVSSLLKTYHMLIVELGYTTRVFTVIIQGLPVSAFV